MSEIDASADLRELLRRYPTGVTVVTSLLNGKPSGGTMNSFTSVSLNPPLVGLFIMSEGRSSNAIRETGRFVVNILKEDQDKTAIKFARDDSEDKFSNVPYEVTEHGIPILKDSLGYIECVLYKDVDVADHVLFVGQVVRASILHDDHALVYHRRDFLSTNRLH